jgi:hypothetical protein
MRTSYHSVSSARRLSSWLMAVLGLVMYVGVVYALTLVPIHFEVPLPHWAVAVIPPVAYGLLVLLAIRRPSVVRWLVGTAVLSGLHVLLTMSREPLSALLDPALAGRPLPWLLPPPFPELVGLVLLLVPLRDVLRAPVRHARERGAGTARPASTVRARPVTAARVQPAAVVESGSGSLSEVLAGGEPEPAPAAATPALPSSPTPLPAPAEDEPRRRRAAARTEQRPEPTRPHPSRSDVVLRIALDRIMGQLPPGTFLAPEDEVAASLSEPGYLRISGELVVTQLAEGVAKVAWHDIADQFPRRLIGLSAAEISEHLGDGVRLPLDEVIGQLPHELFVADTPEVEIPGLDRIPVPFQESEAAPSAAGEAVPVLEPEAPVAVEPPPAPRPAVAAPPQPPVDAPRPPMPSSPAAPAAPEPARTPPAPVGVAPAPTSGEPMVRVSFSRLIGQIPAEAFGVPLDQVAERLQQPGVILVPQSVVVPQLVEGMIQVSWDLLAAQFPAADMTMSSVEMAARLPEGIQLPLDEVIRQVPPDLFLAAGPAPDVRGLENFPAPFQPLLSDPAPESRPAAEPAPPAEEAPLLIGVEESTPLPPPVAESPAVVVEDAPELPAVPGPVIEQVPEPVAVTDLGEEEPPLMVEPDPRGPEADLVLADLVVADEPAVSVQVPAVPAPVEPTAEAPRWSPPVPAESGAAWPEVPPAPVPVPAQGAGEIAEARRIAVLLAPIGSFDVSVQAVEGVTVYAMAAPTVAPETAIAAAGLALPLVTERRLPWPVDQITFRGPDTALVLTPLGAVRERAPVLAAAAPRGRALALLEILCRRAAAEGGRLAGVAAAGAAPAAGHRGLAPAPVPGRAAGLASTLTAFGDVVASVLRDAESEAVFYSFLPAGGHALAVGAFAQDLQAVMRKAAGSGAVFRSAIVRSGDTLLVIQPEEIGHGRSIVIVAGGAVTRPGLAYRQVERAAATLMSA